MKSLRISILAFIMLFSFSLTFVNAQEEEKTSPFTAGADIYSSYVWRGTKFAGPSIQPSVSYSIGGLKVGVWGSYGVVLGADNYTSYYETDPYLLYSFDFGLSLGMTAYYYEGDMFEFTDTTASYAYELNGGYTIGGLSLSGNYILNDSHAGALSVGGDLYFQAGYAFKNFNISIGAGNGWHTSDTEFNLCHIALGTSKSIDITDKFSVPVNGSFVVNPEKKQMFLVVGFSL